MLQSVRKIMNESNDKLLKKICKAIKKRRKKCILLKKV